MKLTVKLFGPIPLDKDNNQVQYVASINEMPGMVETGSTKKEAWDQLMISLQVKILYDSGITEILSSGETTGENEETFWYEFERMLTLEIFKDVIDVTQIVAQLKNKYRIIKK